MKQGVGQRKRAYRPTVRERLVYGRDTVLAVLRRQPPIPRPGLMLGSGRESFIQAGRRLADVLVNVAELRADERVLDIGCGPGRVTRALARYLTSAGSYEGFDVVPEAIAWCQRTIAPRHPNFRFTHVDLRNAMYNQDGSIQPSRFAFPYPDEDFDLVFLFSVFTHMLPPDVERYLQEIRRVLRPGGRALMTFFLLNAQSEEAIEAGRATRTFPNQGDGYRSDSRAVHERAVAYPEAWVREVIVRGGLLLREPIRYGRWRGEQSSTIQDVVLAMKPDRGISPSAPGGSS